MHNQEIFLNFIINFYDKSINIIFRPILLLENVVLQNKQKISKQYIGRIYTIARTKEYEGRKLVG